MKSLEYVDVLDFLEWLEIRNVSDEGEEVKFSCPFPGHLFGDEKPSAYMNASTTAFYCHSCHARGTAVHFLARMRSCSPLAAATELRQRYKPGFVEPDHSMVDEWDRHFRQGNTEPPAPVPVLSEETLNMFPRTWACESYMEKRGFSFDTTTDWQIGYDERTERVTIPVRNAEGGLVGFKGRTVSDHPAKYLVLGDTTKMSGYGFAPYETRRVIFGLNKNTGYDDVVVTEGELNVIALHQAGVTASCGFSGSEISDEQCRILLRHVGSVILRFDSGDAGEHGLQKAISKLEPYMPVKIWPPHKDDPASMTKEQIRDHVANAYSSLELYLP